MSVLYFPLWQIAASAQSLGRDGVKLISIAAGDVDANAVRGFSDYTANVPYSEMPYFNEKLLEILCHGNYKHTPYSIRFTYHFLRGIS